MTPTPAEKAASEIIGKFALYQLNTDLAMSYLTPIIQAAIDEAMPKWAGWQLISKTPVPEDGYFMVCGDRGDGLYLPLFVRADLFKQATSPGNPHHLSLNHMTHWAPLPQPPEDAR